LWWHSSWSGGAESSPSSLGALFCSPVLLVGRFRTHLGGGGPGFGVLPDRIVEDGPYRYVRNPMYLGHLIFMLGLAVTLSRGLHSSCSPRARSGFTAACSRTKRALRRYLDGLISIISGG
jgi:protein-S-isoprenylcysteine O-methyltransferase Ste14